MAEYGPLSAAAKRTSVMEYKVDEDSDESFENDESGIEDDSGYFDSTEKKIDNESPTKRKINSIKVL